jgi:electron transport complex protein RnfC
MSQSAIIARSGVWSIPGGIHPEQHKLESKQTPIEAIPVPSQLWLPLSMHIGAEAIPVVQTGDTVRKGQVIAKAQLGISANIHAPTSGRILSIEEHCFAHESDLPRMAIQIEADGQDAWRDQEPWPNWQEKTHEDILVRVREGGLAGMGGAGFPTDIKYRNKHTPIHTLLINAAECEPYITSDDRLMQERAEDILKGAQISKWLLEAQTIIIGIEDNKPEAINALEAAANALALDIAIAVVPTKYPSGGERQLIQLTTGEEVPHGGLPSDLGILCQNVGTLYQLYRTVVFDEPLISRITTVTGKAVQKPGNYEVLIGTSMKTVLEHAETNLKKADRIIMGGPMMGFALPNIEAPLLKTTNCLLAPTAKELPAAMLDNPCIRCGMCEQACPVGLLPQQMLWAAKNRELDAAELHNLNDCIECGACAYVCPSRIPLVHYYRYAKGELKQEAADNAQSERARMRFVARQDRLEREKLEKEVRRKARAEAAAKALAAKKAQQAATDAGETVATKDPSDDPIKAALERAAAKRKAKADATPKETE